MPILGTKGNNMLINCPKCQTTYNIDASAVPEGGRKLHCTNCDEIFWCNPEDLEEPTRLLTEEEKRGGIAAARLSPKKTATVQTLWKTKLPSRRMPPQTKNRKPNRIFKTFSSAFLCKASKLTAWNEK